MDLNLDLGLFAGSNLAAWCVVPYDDRDRTPRERAAMLQRLGLTRLVWDWREQHAPLFAEELDALTDADIELTGFWCPGAAPDDDALLGSIDPHVEDFVAQAAARSLRPQLWTCAEFGEPGPFTPLPPAEHAARVRRTAAHLAPLARLGARHGMSVGLYNHLGWFGEPENQIEVVEALAAEGITNVGLVYQQHHGHAHLERFALMWPTIAPHVLALGLNGMVTGAHWGGRKIHPYGHGEWDVALARVVAESGWRGVVSILCHTMDDAEARLADNLDGLEWVLSQLRDDAGATSAPPPARIPAPVWPH